MVTASWKVRSSIIGIAAGIDSAHALGLVDGRLVFGAMVFSAAGALIVSVIRFIINPA